MDHLENLTLQKLDEKEALTKHVMQQVTGVYRLTEEDAAQRLAAHNKDLQVANTRTHTHTHTHTPHHTPQMHMQSILNTVPQVTISRL